MTRTNADTHGRLNPSRHTLAVVLVAVLVGLSGCSGILGNSGGTTPTPGSGTATGASGAGDTPPTAGATGGGSDTTNTGRTNQNPAGDTNGATSQTSGDGSGGDASPSGGEDSATGPTEIRLAHMSPDAPALDLYLDDQRVLTNVSVGEISEYSKIQPGSHMVRIADTNNPDSVAFNHSYTFPNGTHTIKMVGEWTVGNANDPRHIAPYILPDNDTPAGPHTAKVRMVDTSPDAPAIDVTTANGTLLFDDISFADSTDYIELSPGTYHLEIRKESGDNTGDVLTNPTIKVGGGGVYTAFVAGYLTPKGEPANMSFHIIGHTDNAPGGS